MDTKSSARPVPIPAGYVSLNDGREQVLGISTGDEILNSRNIAAALGTPLPATLDELIAVAHVDSVQQAVKQYLASGDRTAVVDRERQAFGPCVANPEKIVAVGLNYRDHAEEIGWPLPDHPLLFNKFNSCLLGHQGVLRLPRADTFKFDYESELVIVMGKTAKAVTEKEALSYVFGYCNGNDFSARDLQVRTSQVMLGKVCDGFFPLGPVIVPAAGVDPDNLDIECWVNGEQRQSSNTRNMIFSCAYLVSYISRYMTLKPGDLILTGTPGGPVMGKPAAEQKWLKAGDEIRTRFQGLGELTFTLA